jgi:hypothetical protein
MAQWREKDGMLILETKAFNRNMDKVLKTFDQEQVPTVMREAMFELLKYTILGNPVDTGRSRAGWTAWTDKMGYETASLIRQGGNATETAIREGKAASSFTEDLKGPNKFIEVLNAVVYTLFLEVGTCKMEAFGMLREAFSTMERGLAAAVKKQTDKLKEVK